MMNIEPRGTAGVAKLLGHDNRSWIASHKSPFQFCNALRLLGPPSRYCLDLRAGADKIERLDRELVSRRQLLPSRVSWRFLQDQLTPRLSS